jgi:hypothetical protein
VGGAQLPGTGTGGSPTPGTLNLAGTITGLTPGTLYDVIGTIRVYSSSASTSIPNVAARYSINQ